MQFSQAEELASFTSTVPTDAPVGHLGHLYLHYRGQPWAGWCMLDGRRCAAVHILCLPPPHHHTLVIRGSWAYDHPLGPLITSEGSQRGCRVHSELWRPGCAQRVAQAGAMWGRMNEDHQGKGNIPCHFARKRGFDRKGCEGQRNKAKRACLQIAAYSQPGGFGPGWEIRSPANFQGHSHLCDCKLAIKD